jgi:hypothetical protein
MQRQSISHSYGFMGTTCLLDSWEKAAMATITFNTTDRNEQVREQIRTALAAYRAMLDTYVGSQAAEEAEHARPHQTPGTTSPSKK